MVERMYGRPPVFGIKMDYCDDDDESRLVIEERSSDSPSPVTERSPAPVESTENRKSVDKFGSTNEKDAASSDTPMSQIQESTEKKLPVHADKIIFSWDKYLEETNSVAAPKECFFQDPTPPTNHFKVGTKIEIPDPRGNDVHCLATIISSHALWICVRLDGEDGSNDHWLICDDERIRPVGSCAKVGKLLQPPYGFMYSLSSFHKFLDQQLRPNDDGSSPAATLDCFAPISRKYHPLVNKFEPGMKLEAIDQRNFNGRLSPATVVDVKNDTVTISYDGWSQAYDNKELYDSRSMFPVGYAAKSRLEIQPPLRVRGRVIQRAIKVRTESAAKNKTKIILRKTKMRRNGTRTRSKNPSTQQSVQSAKLKEKESDDSDFHVFRLPSISRQQKRQSEGTKVVKELGSSLDNLRKVVKKKPEPTENFPATTPKQPAKRARTTAENRQLWDDRLTVSLKTESKPNEPIVIHVNHGCRHTPALDPEKVRRLPQQFGPSALHHTVREVVQQIVNCAAKPADVFQCVRSGTPKLLTITADVNNATSIRSLPSFKQEKEVWEYLKDFIKSLHICPNFISPSIVQCSECIKRRPPSSGAVGKNRGSDQISVGSTEGSHVDGDFGEKQQAPVNFQKPVSIELAVQRGPDLLVSRMEDHREIIGARKPEEPMQKSKVVLSGRRSELSSCEPKIGGQDLSHDRSSEPGSSRESNRRSCEAPSQGSTRTEQPSRQTSHEPGAMELHSTPVAHEVALASSSLEDWTTEMVASEIETYFGQEIAGQFVNNQIDGNALVLLTMDLLIRHMDLTYGPALKLMAYIESKKNNTDTPVMLHKVPNTHNDQSSNIQEWSVNRVAAEIEKVSNAEVAKKFKKAEIDGLAMTMLSTDTMMNQLNVSFGPALKISAFIEKLKSTANQG